MASELDNHKNETGSSGAHQNSATDLNLVSLHKSDLLAKNDETCLSGFAGGLVDGAVRQPVKAVKQLFGASETSSAELEHTKIESSSHKVGQIVGSLAPFVLLGIATRKASTGLLGAETTPSLYRAMAEQATTGFIMGSVLTPSELKPGENIYAARLLQGGQSAATFASMTAGAGVLDRFLPKAGEAVTPLVIRRLSIAALSGAGGGIVDAELKSGFKASGQELLESAAGYAAFGTIMEGGNMAARAYLMKGSRNASASENNNDGSARKSTDSAKESAGPAEKTNDPGAVLDTLGRDRLPLAREEMLGDLKNFQGGAKEGMQTFELYKKLMQSDWLTDAQKTRLTDVLADVRDYYAKINEADHTHAGRAQRSWTHSQAAVAEVINDTMQAAKIGIKPTAAQLEDKVLVALFSQFRMHRDEPFFKLTSESMRADREMGAQKILSSIGYSQDRIDSVVTQLKSTSLAAAPLDLVKFDADQIKSMETGKGIVKSTRSPELTSTEPLTNGLIERQLGMEHMIKQTFDSDGKIIQASLGDTREFIYDANGRLKRIISANLGNVYESAKYEGKWFREGRDADGKLILVDGGWTGKTIADHDGSIRVITPDNNVRLFGIDGTETLYKPNGRPELKSVNSTFEHQRLQDKVKSNFLDPKRLERFQSLLTSFDRESTARNLDDNQKGMFYKQLSKMLTYDTTSKLDLAERRELAEQVLNHAAYPTTIDQGCNSTCNVTTIENRLYTRTPQLMAGMIEEVTDTGAYTTFNGNKVEMARSLSGLQPDTQARSSLQLQESGKGDVKIDGKRDWASQLAQTVLVKIKHLDTTEFISRDGIIVDADDLVYNKARNLVGKTPSSNISTLLDAHGKPVSKLNDGEPVFVKTNGLLQEVDPGRIVYTHEGDLKGTISDGTKLTKLYDYFGKPDPKVIAGSNYYDTNGNLVIYQTVPGQITYDKILPQPDASGKVTGKEVERLHIKHLGERYFLKEVEDGKTTTISSPNMSSYYYLDIANQVTGTDRRAFAIYKGDSYIDGFRRTRISTPQELESTLLKLQNENNLPGVLRVHTSNKWFDGSGGWHAVNYQSYDPVTQTAKITNQWGSQYDHMVDGVPLQELFKAMSEATKKS